MANNFGFDKKRVIQAGKEKVSLFSVEGGVYEKHSVKRNIVYVVLKVPELKHQNFQ